MASMTGERAIDRPGDWIASGWLPVLFGLITGIALVLPRSLPVPVAILALTFVAIVAVHRYANPAPDTAGPFGKLGWEVPPAILGFLAFAAYCLVSAAWSPVPASALVKASWLVLLIATVGVGMRLWEVLAPRDLDRALVPRRRKRRGLRAAEDPETRLRTGPPIRGRGVG